MISSLNPLEMNRNKTLTTTIILTNGGEINLTDGEGDKHRVRIEGLSFVIEWFAFDEYLKRLELSELERDSKINLAVLEAKKKGAYDEDVHLAIETKAMRRVPVPSISQFILIRKTIDCENISMVSQEYGDD